MKIKICLTNNLLHTNETFCITYWIGLNIVLGRIVRVTNQWKMLHGGKQVVLERTLLCLEEETKCSPAVHKLCSNEHYCALRRRQNVSRWYRNCAGHEHYCGLRRKQNVPAFVTKCSVLLQFVTWVHDTICKPLEYTKFVIRIIFATLLYLQRTHFVLSEYTWLLESTRKRRSP